MTTKEKIRFLEAWASNDMWADEVAHALGLDENEAHALTVRVMRLTDLLGLLGCYCDEDDLSMPALEYAALLRDGGINDE